MSDFLLQESQAIEQEEERLSPLTSWRLLDTGYLSAAKNMALDDVILDCRARDLVPNTIRFLQFHPPAVLVGYNQSIEQEVRMTFCKDQGIEINRRLTGGGAIFFDETSLGWEILASKSELSVHQPVTKVFEQMCQGPILALRQLGVPASFRPKNDIEVNGRKISGTGGTERDGAFLFQGTLLVDFDVNTMLRALRIPVMKLKDKEIQSVKERVTCIRWELGRQPSLETIKTALKRGFERAFKIRLVDGQLTPPEQILLNDRLTSFQSDSWVFSDRRPLNDAAEVSSIAKTPGGLIRVSLAVDTVAKVIKTALITGDFFPFPSRAILDLEATLKYTSYDTDEIPRLVHDFFQTTRTQILGVAPDDLVKVIRQATGKTEYEALGITLSEANYVYPINTDPYTFLKDGCEVLLLPYCAKLPTCEYRSKDGCVKCGKCSIGRAYDLAEQVGLTPITIQNFEHLMATLKALRQKGVKGYLGCCCEGFYGKHQDDLEHVRIPGLLIDIEDQTCYDLGKEAEALQGSFESQTELKIDLLAKLATKIRPTSRIEGRKHDA